MACNGLILEQRVNQHIIFHTMGCKDLIYSYTDSYTITYWSLPAAHECFVTKNTIMSPNEDALRYVS